ncbi:hypothetical protein ACQQCD_13005 [Pseudarthrobacter sp. J1763]|uniref:hypothetical protein n=1 Tax=Pseudarthrobacter sp. J1763 TaxID=3420445 RepID=UPI003D2C32A0
MEPRSNGSKGALKATALVALGGLAVVGITNVTVDAMSSTHAAASSTSTNQSSQTTSGSTSSSGPSSDSGTSSDSGSSDSSASSGSTDSSGDTSVQQGNGGMISGQSTGS